MGSLFGLFEYLRNQSPFRNLSITETIEVKMKTGKQIVALLIMLLGIVAAVPACGETFTGKVAVKGNEPFTYLVLVTDKGDLKITGPLQEKIRDSFQGRIITVKGTIVKKKKGFMALSELEATEIVNVER